MEHTAHLSSILPAVSPQLGRAEVCCAVAVLGWFWARAGASGDSVLRWRQLRVSCTLFLLVAIGVRRIGIVPLTVR